MAGLSIMRRRKAWLRGVVYGAAGFGCRCTITHPKLREIYTRAVSYGRANIDVPYVKAVVAQFKARFPRRANRATRIMPRKVRPDLRNTWLRQ